MSPYRKPLSLSFSLRIAFYALLTTLFLLHASSHGAALRSTSSIETTSKNVTSFFDLAQQDQLQKATEKKALQEKERLQKKNKKNVMVVAFSSSFLLHNHPQVLPPIETLTYFEEKKKKTQSPHLVFRLMEELIRKDCLSILSFYSTSPICAIGRVLLTYILPYSDLKLPFVCHEKGCLGNPPINQDDILPFYPFIESKFEGLPEKTIDDIHKILGLFSQKILKKKMFFFSDLALGDFTKLIEYLKTYPLETLTCQDKKHIVLLCAQKGGLQILQFLYHNMSPKERQIVLNTKHKTVHPEKKDCTPVLLSLLSNQNDIFTFLYGCKEVHLNVKNNQGKYLLTYLFQKEQYSLVLDLLNNKKIPFNKKKYNDLNRYRSPHNKQLLNTLKKKLATNKKKAQKNTQKPKQKKKKRR